MATTSSRLAAATTRLGMPLSVPSPAFWSANMPLTTTAGDTAARMNPSVSPMKIGIPNRPRDTSPTTTASVTPGQRVSRRATRPTLLNDRQSSSRPERMNMIDRPATRIAEDHSSGSPRTGSPGMFRRRTPANSMPIREGSFISSAISPKPCEVTKSSTTENAGSKGSKCSPTTKRHAVFPASVCKRFDTQVCAAIKEACGILQLVK
mmetsp:Transcript_17332/g.41394  ORF Transcript_17332/g.41394 Transcript_17332/m.41394 type:complete len:207 (-) Transcript_17332:380-1000(-)